MTTNTNQSKLYLAYGANVSAATMRERCPGATFLGTVTLRDYALVFRGVGDMVRWNGQTADWNPAMDLPGLEPDRFRKAFAPYMGIAYPGG